MRGHYSDCLMRRRFSIVCLLTMVSLIFTFSALSRLSQLSSDEKRKVSKIDNMGSIFPTLQFDITAPGERKNWHDYAAMKTDAKRIGPGENGTAAFNTDNSYKKLEKRMSLANGFNAFVSDLISVNRSVPDVRHENCRKKRYFVNLPTISIIIPCRNEYDSVLKRTLHSIFNRTPRELLKEIIIVDDNSQHGYYIEEMTLYVEEHFPNLVKFIRLPERKGTHFPNLVKFIRLPERKGLIYARQRGAKIARGDVLVFFDSYIECNYNWLPPLLEPIAIDDRISTSPLIDKIYRDTFQYEKSEEDYSRGGFAWDLTFKKIKFQLSSDADKSKPYKNAIMTDSVFAINKRFFWKLGGFDDFLNTYEAAQFEMSFKIGMCGGSLLSVPCSRIGKISFEYWDNSHTNHTDRKDNKLVAINIKRVAELWLDDYKRILYDGEPDIYANLKIENLTERYELRERLQCESFNWFLQIKASDVLKYFPPVSTEDYAIGILRSVAFPEHCLVTFNGGEGSLVGMSLCGENPISPQENQYWHLNLQNQIQNRRKDLCLEANTNLPNARLHMLRCNYPNNKQYWSYDTNFQWVQWDREVSECLEVKRNGELLQAVVNDCDFSNERMRWTFGYMNLTALNSNKTV